MCDKKQIYKDEAQNKTYICIRVRPEIRVLFSLSSRDGSSIGKQNLPDNLFNFFFFFLLFCFILLFSYTIVKDKKNKKTLTEPLYAPLSFSTGRNKKINKKKYIF